MNLKSMSMSGLYKTYKVQKNNDRSLVHFITYDRKPSGKEFQTFILR